VTLPGSLVNLPFTGAYGARIPCRLAWR
jgi:hypothetical protein